MYLRLSVVVEASTYRVLDVADNSSTDVAGSCALTRTSISQSPIESPAHRLLLGKSCQRIDEYVRAINEMLRSGFFKRRVAFSAFAWDKDHSRVSIV